MAKPHIVVDLSLLQQFSAPGLWWRIDPRVRKSIASLREVDERVEGVERFSLRIGNEYKPQEDDLSGSRMFLRAALSEFVSMEDAAAFDFQSLGRSASPTIEKLDDPRLHVVRLLRHANVHL